MEIFRNINQKETRIRINKIRINKIRINKTRINKTRINKIKSKIKIKWKLKK